MDKNNKNFQTSKAKSMMGRRAFVATTLAAGASLGLASERSSQSQSDEPKKGGTLRVGFTQGALSDSTDPASFNNDFMFAYAYGVFNGLTEIAPNGELVPELAEQWQASPDARIWTFQLRRGIQFHNGKDFVAADVVATINHHRHINSTSSAKPLVADIVRVTALDSHTVVMELGSGNADFPFIFSQYNLVIHPALGDSIDVTSMNGTGPYEAKIFDPGVRAVYQRNPNYWKPDRAHLDTVEIILVADPAARLSALITGAVDLIDRPDLKTLHLLKRHPSIRVEQTVGNKHYTLPMLSDIVPFTNNDVRMALKHAIDREEMVEKILKGCGVVGNDHPIGPTVPFFNSDLPQRSYDPDKARFYLNRAGLKTLDVKLHMADVSWGNDSVKAGVLFSESSAKAGINLQVLREPNDGYWSNVWMKKAFCGSYSGGRPTADWAFTTTYARGVSWNESHWDHSRFNQLLVAARSELDQALRGEMYYEMQGLVRDEGSTIIPMFGNYVLAMNKHVRHTEKIASNWDLDGQRFMERWWLDA